MLVVETIARIRRERFVKGKSIKCWNWFNPGHQQRGRGEPSLIAGITRQVMRDYSVDSRRVYVAGLSAGAAAAVIMGITYPDLYAAIGAHSGLACGAASDLHSAFAVMRQGEAVAVRRSGGASDGGGYRRIVPTIVFHGDQDKTVHPRNGDRIIEQSRANMTANVQIRVQHGRIPGGHAYSRTLHTDASGQAVLEQWIIHGAGPTLGRAAAPPARTPIREGPTPRGRCSASSSSTPTQHVRSRVNTARHDNDEQHMQCEAAIPRLSGCR
jgi:poly(hydroxyalkanoate) depolymerase family esterase